MSSTSDLGPVLTGGCRVVGLGHAGCKIVEALAAMPEASWLGIAAADTDANVESIRVPHRFLLGAEWSLGLGCGGDILKGERCVAHVSNSGLDAFLSDAALTFVVGGLGGGTATGGASVLGRLIRRRKSLLAYVLTLPFNFEGHTKGRAADKVAAELSKGSDLVFCVPNDLLFSSVSHSEPAELCFQRINVEAARAVLGIAEILRCGSMIPLDYNDFRSIMSRSKCECGIGIGSASSDESPDRCRLALERLLASALLGGARAIREADAVVATIVGGPDLSIGEMKHSLEVLERLAGAKAQFSAGANTDPAYAGRVQITVVPIRFDIIPEVAPVGPLSVERRRRALLKARQSSSGSSDQIQPELPLQNISRGMFTNTTPTLHNGEDLDIPTFQRRGVHVDDGKKFELRR